jgi:hypothetical protein
MKKNKIKMGSNKSFGIVFFIVFLIIAFWPFVSFTTVKIWSLIISIIFLVLGMMNSKILSPLNLIWFKFGILLGSIVSPIVMSIIFFVVITPIGIIMRMLGKDLLNKKYNKKKSYWIIKDNSKSSMKQQF